MNTILDLGNIPLVNNLKSSSEEAHTAKRYPLRAVMDDNMVVRLDTDVPPTEMFGEYLYRSAVSKPYRDHCESMWRDVKQYIYGDPLYCSSVDTPLIVDIGGNDGTLLKAFKNQHLEKLDLFNVDPSDFIADNAEEKISYIQDYWGEHINLPRKANLIVSTNVFQHNPNVREFLAGIKKHLNGVWVLEFPYFLSTAETNQFDQFYHEHYFYWLVTPLVRLFKEYGLGIISITQHPIHGGTMRIVSTNLREGDSELIEQYIQQEKNFDFVNWADCIHSKICSDNELLSNISKEGKIACFGAAAKGCVYLNSIDPSIVNKMVFVVDDTKGKQGKYVPGTKLRVVGRETLYEEQPEYLLLLAHNFKVHIINSLRPHYKGKIIVMLPEVEIHE